MRLQVWYGHSPVSLSHVHEFIQRLQHLPTGTNLLLDVFFMVSTLSSNMRLPIIPLEGVSKQWKKEQSKRWNHYYIFLLEVRSHTRGFYTARRETQLFVYTPSGMTIFVPQSHFSAGISQCSFHGMHCSQLDATNCPITILRNSFVCFSNLENKGALQTELTGKSYIFNTR